MVIALLVCLAATVATGLIAYGEQGKGPVAAALAVGEPTQTAMKSGTTPKWRREGSERKASWADGMIYSRTSP